MESRRIHNYCTLTQGEVAVRIAFIVNTFPNLSETFVLNQITGLLDRGHEVEIIAHMCTVNPEEEKVHPNVGKYQLMKRVRYINIPKNKFTRVFKAIWLIVRNFHKSPLKIIKSLNVFKYGKKALSLRLLYTLIPFLDEDFDIIHCHFGPNGIIGAYLKEIGINGKLVTTFHGNDMSAYVLRHGMNVYKNLFSKGDLFMPVSEYWKRKLIKMGCEEGKIIVHHMGINLERFNFFERRKPEVVKILSVGRLVEKKGHEYAIRALAKIINKHKNVIYQIVGDGPLKGKLESLVRDLDIENHVEFLGVVDDEELLDIYKESHIFILPSVTSSEGDQEGIPVVLMETQATGLPVISTHHSGIPEVVLDGKSGFLVTEKDVDALAKKLEHLIKHPEIWPKMGNAGRKIIEKHYDIDKLNDQLVEIYQKLVDGELTKNGRISWTY